MVGGEIKQIKIHKKIRENNEVHLIVQFDEQINLIQIYIKALQIIVKNLKQHKKIKNLMKIKLTEQL